MADPAWGTTSLSDEETARALCAFQLRGPREQPEMPQLTPGGGRAAFGYPASGSYHMVAMRQGDAASLLVGMHAPSTSSDDWQQQQNRAIREQIQQEQRELHAQTQQRQQQEVAAQIQQLGAQIHRQSQVQRQEVERIQQPRYSAEGTGVNHRTWIHGGRMTGAATLTNRSQCAPMQQSTQSYDGGFRRSPQATTTRMNFAGDLQAAVSMSGNDRTFATQQATQSHFHARNPENSAASALHPWGMSNALPFSGMQGDRTAMQIAQRFMPEQPQQPQPYHSAEARGRRDQVASMPMHASRTAPNDAFLNGIMSHFPTTGESEIGGATAKRAPNAVLGSARGRNFMNDVAPAQFQPRAPAKIQSQHNAQSRLPLPPAGSTIVPGVSLALPPTRLMTMRDILNVEDVASNVAPSRSRPRGVKQHRAPRKRKDTKKKTPGKLQRRPQQRNEQRLLQPQSIRPSGLLANQGASLGPTGVSASASNSYTPMHQAFIKKSQAARALQQTTIIPSTKPSAPPVRLAPSSDHSRTQATDPTAGVVAEGQAPVRKTYKRKRVDVLPGRPDPPATTRLEHQSISNNAPGQAAPKPGVCMDKRALEFYQGSTTERVPTNMQQVLLNEHTRSVGVFENPTNGAIESQLYQLQSQNKLVGGEMEKRASSTQQRRKAKLPQTVSNQLTKHGPQQQVACELSVPLGNPTVSISNPVSSATSCSVAEALAVSNPPRVQNRTVVIFCKRDFMRYQAARIWRKYQEQIKKQEEWREVRVAGKRTRYLNYRYADELRKQHNKTYKRAARPPKKAPQEVQMALSHDATSSATHADPMELAKALSRLINNGDNGYSPPRKPTVDADSGSSSLSSANGMVSNGKPDTADDSGVGVILQDAPLPPIFSDGEKINHAASTSINEPSNDSVIHPANVHAGANAAFDGNLSLVKVDDGDMGNTPSRRPAVDADSGSLAVSSANGMVSNGKSDTDVDSCVGVMLQDTPLLPVSSGGEKTNHAVLKSINEPSNNTVAKPADVHAGVNAASDGNLKLAVVDGSPKADGVAGAISIDNIELPVEFQDHFSVSNTVSDCHVADSSPSGDICIPSIDEPSTDSVEIIDGVNVVATAIGNAGMGDIDNVVAGVVPSGLESASANAGVAVDAAIPSPTAQHQTRNEADDALEDNRSQPSDENPERYPLMPSKAKDHQTNSAAQDDIVCTASFPGVTTNNASETQDSCFRSAIQGDAVSTSPGVPHGLTTGVGDGDVSETKSLRADLDMEAEMQQGQPSDTGGEATNTANVVCVDTKNSPADSATQGDKTLRREPISTDAVTLKNVIAGNLPDIIQDKSTPTDADATANNTGDATHVVTEQASSPGLNSIHSVIPPSTDPVTNSDGDAAV